MEKTLYKVSENSFTAREVIFAGTPGYMVCQYNRGRKVAEQFVDADGYKAFCDIIGVVPTIIDERDTPQPEAAQECHKRKRKPCRK